MINLTLDMKFIRLALLKHAKITNEFLAENCPRNNKSKKKGVDKSLINREINGIGLNTDYIRRFIWKTFVEKTKSKITYKTFWQLNYKLTL